jgi:phosphoglycerate dehydrogenase-like enzyme
MLPRKRPRVIELLNVLVITPAFDKALPQADPDTLKQISLVSPRISVKDASSLVAAEFRGDGSSKSKLNALLARTDVIFGLIPPQDILKRAPRLKWIQMMSAGVDRLRGTEIWQSDVIITGVSGIHATPIGEFVLELMLMFAKKAPLCFQMKQNHEWRRFMPTGLKGKTVGIAGLGHIGREVARLSKAFGMRVIATRRSAKIIGSAKYVDRLLPAKRLPSLLADSDFVVISVPLTKETFQLIGEKELKAMKPTAYIINIARGNVIDEKALIHALEEKQIAGAGLDVTAKEPLPAKSPLWDMDNVILSPHISGGMEDYVARATDLFCDNLKRYITSRKLRNIIDRKLGY